MSKREKKPKDFCIFPNKYKKKSRHPDMMGWYIDANGEEHEIVAWAMEGRNGKFYAGKITPKEEAKAKYGKPNNPANKQTEDPIDDLPFGE